MILYFAYGSNMDTAAMRARCPDARAVGRGAARRLPIRYRRRWLGLGADRAPGPCVHGVLWRASPRDMAALHAYELLDKGVYKMRYLPVRVGAQARALR